MEGHKKPIDFKRSLQFSMLGMIYIAPISHVNYTYVLPALAPMSKGVSLTQVALKKVTFD